MSYIKVNDKYKISNGSISIIEMLSPGIYVVRCNQEEGFFLEKYGNIGIVEKVYGQHQKKIEKAFNAFDNMDRNLGILLSGDKGIGKTLFLKMLAAEAIQRGMVVIVVDRYYTGIDAFLIKITQECIILFDEYEKRFGESDNTVSVNDNDFGYNVNPFCSNNSMMSLYSHQTELLELFDGISGGKKMFVLTCNEIGTINNYLIDRPGRIHYHFRFAYPTPKDIMQYLKDNLKPEYHSEIQTVLNYSVFTKISYDSLRAITFEINSGLGTEEALSDLNISRDMKSCPKFNVQMHFSNGYVSAMQTNRINFFGDESARIELRYRKRRSKQKLIKVEFLINDLKLNEYSSVFMLPAEKIQDAYIECQNERDDADAMEMLENDGLEYIAFSKRFY